MTASQVQRSAGSTGGDPMVRRRTAVCERPVQRAYALAGEARSELDDQPTSSS